MHYKCKKCDYEFDVQTTPHPHDGMLFLPMGCPVCLKQQAMKKICPKCGSIDLIQSLYKKEEE